MGTLLCLAVFGCACACLRVPACTRGCLCAWVGETSLYPPVLIPQVVGCFCLFRSTTPLDAAQALNRSILALFSAFVSPDGKAVDYPTMAASPLFQQYLQAAFQLAVGECRRHRCADCVHGALRATLAHTSLIHPWLLCRLLSLAAASGRDWAGGADSGGDDRVLPEPVQRHGERGAAAPIVPRPVLPSLHACAVAKLSHALYLCCVAPGHARHRGARCPRHQGTLPYGFGSMHGQLSRIHA